jgi:hypothetical protein
LLPNTFKLSKKTQQQQTSKKMMLNLNRIDKKERLMRAMTGLIQKQFDELLGDFESACEKAMDKEKENQSSTIGRLYVTNVH